MSDESKLTITIQNINPVELMDFTQAFLSLSDEYHRYLSLEDSDALDQDVKLYVKQIRTGSIVADLVALAPLALPFAENANTILGFSKYVRTGIGYLLGTQKNKPVFEKADYLNLSNIVAPIAKDNGSQINFNTTINGDVALTLNVTSLEANAIQNAATREMAALREPGTGFHDKVLLYWYQARNDPKSQRGDKAIVESIISRPVKVLFANESIKAQLLSGEANPFKHAYVVDLAVETIAGVPRLFKILNIHDRVDVDERSET